MAKFENIRVGDKAEIQHVITVCDVDRFVALTGDDNKIHVDSEFAHNTSFRNPVAHGMLSASFISTVIGTRLPGDGALWYAQSLEFLLPVRIGDTIRVVAQVVSKHESTKTIELQTDVFNQDKQKVISGRSKVKVIEEIVSTSQHPYTGDDIVDRDTCSVEGHARRRVALVIGASGGIGSATARQLASLGYDVALHYFTNSSRVEELIAEIGQTSGISEGQSDVTDSFSADACRTGQGSVVKVRTLAVQADISDQKSIEDMVHRTVRRLGNIEAVVNCSAIRFPRTKFDNLDWSDISRQLEFSVRTNFMLARAVVPTMKALGGGTVVMLASESAEGVPPAEMLAYVVAKYAMNGLGKALAVELAALNIRVNFVSPGMTDTDLIANVSEKTKLLVAARTPLKRLASPTDVARAIGFLVSVGDYLTGETIRVNGGSTMI